jgi:heptosyltransferase-3
MATLSQLATVGRTSRFVRRVRNAVRWRIEPLRQGFLIRKASWKARSVIRRLASLKSANPGRPFCGILLIEHIGDIIACEPIIEQLRAARPTAFVVWIARRQYAELLASHPKLDAVVLVDSLLIVGHIVQSRIFDLAVDLHVNLKMTEIPGVLYEKTSGDPAIDIQSYVFHGSLLEAFSRSAGIDPRSAAPTMYVPEGAVGAVDRLALPEHFVAIHASSNLVQKDWSPSRWRELVRHILDHYETHVIEIGLTGVINVDDPRFINLCGKLSIIETAELIRRCAFFVGIDSGPAHMANAWRRPGLLLFGRHGGSGTFNPFDGYYREMAETVILRHTGALHDQPTSWVTTALEASPLWKETHNGRTPR